MSSDEDIPSPPPASDSEDPTIDPTEKRQTCSYQSKISSKTVAKKSTIAPTSNVHIPKDEGINTIELCF